MALFSRAERLPYLLCCIAIDEVDALAPKRNEKSGEHKVDILCLLLSLIGGIKDVPNVYVIASTNRLNKMDEAFCRRLQTKFFVGRLPPQKRLEILKKVTEVKINDESIEFPTALDKYTQQLTINFSGAAIESYRSRIVSFLHNNNSVTVTPRILSTIGNQVARDFQILLGSYSIPILISSSFNSEELKLKEKRDYTGRILVDLTDEDECVIYAEYKEKKKKYVDEHNFKNIKLAHEVVPILLKMGIKHNVDFVQMFDTSMLLNNAAFDDNTVMETVLEKIGEWEQYTTSMAIFDVDSLVGVNENVSDSSMGQSSSSSITNNRLWNQVVIQTSNSKLEDPNGDGHKWIAVITKNKFISAQFKSLASFPHSESDKKQQEEDLKDRICFDCETPYKNCKNGLGDCIYHDGPIVDMRVKDPRNFVPIKRQHLLRIVMTANDRQKDLQNYLYLCCFQPHQSAGCKKSYHCDDEDESKENHEMYLENI